MRIKQTLFYLLHNINTFLPLFSTYSCNTAVSGELNISLQSPYIAVHCLSVSSFSTDKACTGTFIGGAWVTMVIGLCLYSSNRFMNHLHLRSCTPAQPYCPATGNHTEFACTGNHIIAIALTQTQGCPKRVGSFGCSTDFLMRRLVRSDIDSVRKL